MDDGNPHVITDREQPMSTADLARATAANPSEGPAADRSASPPLLPESEIADLKTRWDQIQTGFVDEPRQAVEDADTLVAAAMHRLAETFASERSQLEGTWDRGGDVSTEDLRIALQRYRSFFGRLLTI